MPLLKRTIAALVWLALICAGFGYAWRYEGTAGAGARAPSEWPGAREIGLDGTRPTAVMFAHPSCPCTRASVDGLAELAARSPGRLKIYVVMVQPRGLAGGLKDWPLAQAAKRVRGAVVLRDAGGVEAKRFTAATSGQVLLYSPQGEKLFSGGLTAARGHYGSSGGTEAIAAILQGERPKTPVTPVFGCSLLGAEG